MNFIGFCFTLYIYIFQIRLLKCKLNTIEVNPDSLYIINDPTSILVCKTNITYNPCKPVIKKNKESHEPSTL